MSIIPDELRDELGADYARMTGHELTAEAIEEMAWEAALDAQVAEHDRYDEPDWCDHDEHDWQDDWRYELGPGPGYDDSPENNDRNTRSRQTAMRRMDVVLPVHGGGYRAYRADLTHRQAIALRSLTLTTWLVSMATHADGLLKEGHGPFTILAADDRDRTHLFRLETDGAIHHTPPRD